MGSLFQDLLNELAKEHYRQIDDYHDELRRARARLRKAGIPDESWRLGHALDSPHPGIATEGYTKKVRRKGMVEVIPRSAMKHHDFESVQDMHGRWHEAQQREAPMINDTDSESMTQGCAPRQVICCNNGPENGRNGNDDLWHEAVRVAQLSAFFSENHEKHRFGFVQDAFALGHAGDSAPDEDVLERVIEVVEGSMKQSQELDGNTTTSLQTHISSRRDNIESPRLLFEEDSPAREVDFENRDSGNKIATPQSSFSSYQLQTRSNSRSKKRQMTLSNLRSISNAPGKRTKSFGSESLSRHGTSDDLQEIDREQSEPRLPGHLNVSPAWTDLAELVACPEETGRSYDSNNLDLNRLMDGSRKSAEQKRMKFKQRGRQGNQESLNVIKTRTHKDNDKLCEMSRFIAQPSSKGRLCWDITGMVLLGYDIIMVPIQVFEPSESFFLQALNYITGGFWTMDLFASFLVGYHRQGTVEMDPFKIAVHYIRSWFLLDAILVLLDWIFLLIGSESQGSSRVMRMGKLSRGMRVMRLLRVMKFRMVFSDIMESIHSEYKRTLIGVAKWVVFIIVINHYIACGFYGLKHVADLLDEENTWVKENLPANGGTFLYRYGTSLHWSLTQFTPASMEVVPENGIERLYNICVLLFALVTFSSFVSSITNAMTYLRNIDAKKLDQDAALRRYLGEHTISNALVNRVLHFLQEQQVKRGRVVRTKEVDVELFKQLPDSLKNELRVEAFQPSINTHPFFHHYGVVEPQALRQICRTAMAEVSLTMHQELFGDGGTVLDMLFLNEGELRYQFPVDDQSFEVHIRKGEWACEAALWAANAELHSPLVAECTCELALFNSADFIVCAKRFPQTLGVVVRYAELFMEDVQKEAAKCRWRSILCNDFDQVQDIVHNAFTEFTKAHGDVEENAEGGLDFDRDDSTRSGGIAQWVNPRSTMTKSMIPGWLVKSFSTTQGSTRFSSSSHH
mmetsp:Transcript_47405/g.88277  ORF Transcript_47405/g.88277 Transcript_47405/m.88277 type:complete len:966 (+) Transcript_47405:63-2960(+)